MRVSRLSHTRGRRHHTSSALPRGEGATRRRVLLCPFQDQQAAFSKVEHYPHTAAVVARQVDSIRTTVPRKSLTRDNSPDMGIPSTGHNEMTNNSVYGFCMGSTHYSQCPRYKTHQYRIESIGNSELGAGSHGRQWTNPIYVCDT